MKLAYELGILEDFLNSQQATFETAFDKAVKERKLHKTTYTQGVVDYNRNALQAIGFMRAQARHYIRRLEKAAAQYSKKGA